MALPQPLILGTRGSQLALWQANHVKDQLAAAGVEAELQQITTRGDREQALPVSEMGDESVFTKELDRALLGGSIHVAVHSLKDIPSEVPDGITLAAIGERASPFDAFVAHPSFDGPLEDLPEGATLATASLRRKAQLKAWRPDLNVVPVRGNVDSRIEKLDASDWHGMVLAVAGLERMGLRHRIRHAIAPEIMVPAVGQGALGIACHADATEVHDLLRETLHHTPSGWAAAAERGFMRRLEGGCQVPTGAWARLAGEEEEDSADSHADASPELVIDGCVAALDGSECYREQRTFTPDTAQPTGAALAETLLDQGGRAILDAILDAAR
jgi:hydroxymethylbilane synthase